MRPLPATLAFVAHLVALDYAANDGDLVWDAVVWSAHTGQDIARAIGGLVMMLFGR